MATNYYSDLMKGYNGSPAFQPQLDMGMQAISRKVPRGSGNVLAALTKYATDLSASDYGNEFDRRLRAQQLGQEGDLAGQRLDLDRTLGTGRLDLDRTLGTGRLGIEQGDLELRRLTGDRDFALGSQRTQNEWDLGNRRAGNEEMDSWRRYDLGGRRQALDESTAANDFTLRNDANSRGWYDSQTQRGTARSADWERRQRNRTQDPWGR